MYSIFAEELQSQLNKDSFWLSSRKLMLFPFKCQEKTITLDYEHDNNNNRKKTI